VLFTSLTGGSVVLLLLMLMLTDSLSSFLDDEQLLSLFNFPRQFDCKITSAASQLINGQRRGELCYIPNNLLQHFMTSQTYSLLSVFCTSRSSLKLTVQFRVQFTFSRTITLNVAPLSISAIRVGANNNVWTLGSQPTYT